MPCTSPLKGWNKAGGGWTPSAKNAVGTDRLSVPCGQCKSCRIQHARTWAARCVHESQMHEQNSFITLTYRSGDLPHDGSVSLRDWQLFAKKLRKAILIRHRELCGRPSCSGDCPIQPPGRFRYFMCGEYGDQNLRPHYHALLFGINFIEDRVKIRDGQYPLWRSPMLDQVWGKGHAAIGSLTYETAAYTARYTMKKVTGDAAKDHYERIDSDTGEVFHVAPEFSTMSRRPYGIGASWLDKYQADIYPSDEVVIGGRHFPTPKFYDQRVDPASLEAVKTKRRERTIAIAHDLTPDRLETRNKVLEATLRALHRNL